MQSLEALLATARARKGQYVAEAPARLGRTRTAVNVLLDALKHEQPLDRAGAALAAVHLRLVRTELGGGAAVAVVEEPSHREGRGIFVWRCGALAHERIVQVPHSFFDEDTLPIGLAAAAAGARALFVNTVHRYPGGIAPTQAVGEEESGAEDSGERPSPADLAHQTETTWQIMTLGALEHFAPIVLLQLHGFADRGDAAHAGEGVVVSPSVVDAGKQAAKHVVARLARALTGVGVCLFPRDTRVLGGTRNAQARLLASHDSGVFLHVEIARTVRRRLASDEVLRGAFVDAVWAGTDP